MDGRLIPGADAGYSSHWPVNLFAWDTTCDPVEYLPAWLHADSVPNYAIQFEPSLQTSHESDWDFVSNDVLSQTVKSPTSRPRTSTVGSQQEPEPAIQAELASGPSASEKQAQRRQNAKVVGQFRCTSDGCPRVKIPFGSSSDLRRHLHELHGLDPNGAFPSGKPCPWPNCVRSEKLFKRQKNLDEHITKKHGGHRPGVNAIADASNAAMEPETALSSQVRAQAPPIRAPSQTSQVITAQRARRADRRKSQELMKQRITTLRQRGKVIADEIAVFKVKCVQMQNKLNEMQASEKAVAETVRTLEELAAEDAEEDAEEAIV